MVLEVYLHDLVAEAEHNCVLRTHPFLYIDGAGRVLQLICLIKLIPLYQLLFLLRIVVLLKVRLEMRQQRHFLLQITRIVREAEL